MGFNEGFSSVSDGVNETIYEEKSLCLVQDKSQENQPTSKRVLPYINAHHAQEALKNAKKIEFIVHPLYNIVFHSWIMFDSDEDLFDNDMLHQLNKRVVDMMHNEEGFMGGVLCICRYLIQEIRTGLDNGGKLPQGIFLLKDIIDEIADYTLPPDDGTVRIFMMPGTDDISPRFIGPSITTFNSMLSAFAHHDTYIVESESSGNGYIQPKDYLILKSSIRPSTNIEIQGGYIGRCVKNTTHGHKDITGEHGPSLMGLDQHTKLELSYDLEASSHEGNLLEARLDIPAVNQRLASYISKNISLVYPSGNIATWTWDDVKMFISQNQTLLRDVDQVIETVYTETNEIKESLGLDGLTIIGNASLEEWLADELDE